MAGPGTPLASEGVRLYFEIRELDDFCRKLQAKHFCVTQMPRLMPWGWRHAYLNDPDSHEINLYWAGENRMKKTVTQTAKEVGEDPGRQGILTLFSEIKDENCRRGASQRHIHPRYPPLSALGSGNQATSWTLIKTFQFSKIGPWWYGKLRWSAVRAAIFVTPPKVLRFPKVPRIRRPKRLG